MADKKTKKQANSEAREGDDTIYKAALKVGDQQLASITIRATDDDDAKEQLERSKPTYFEGIGDWSLTKTETVEVK